MRTGAGVGVRTGGGVVTGGGVRAGEGADVLPLPREGSWGIPPGNMPPPPIGPPPPPLGVLEEATL